MDVKYPELGGRRVKNSGPASLREQVYQTLRRALQKSSIGVESDDHRARPRAGARSLPHPAVVPNSQLRALIDQHADQVQRMRHLTLHDPKVRKKVLAGLRNILAASNSAKAAAAATARATHLDAAEAALTIVLEQTNSGRPAA